MAQNSEEKQRKGMKKEGVVKHDVPWAGVPRATLTALVCQNYLIFDPLRLSVAVVPRPGYVKIDSSTCPELGSSKKCSVTKVQTDLPLNHSTSNQHRVILETEARSSDTTYATVARTASLLHGDQAKGIYVTKGTDVNQSSLPLSRNKGRAGVGVTEERTPHPKIVLNGAGKKSGLQIVGKLPKQAWKEAPGTSYTLVSRSSDANYAMALPCPDAEDDRGIAIRAWTYHPGRSPPPTKQYRRIFSVPAPNLTHAHVCSNHAHSVLTLPPNSKSLVL
ncbi:unnamed protein product [Larinioides sclopetarius]|uniref:Uncharacterized protein n=1 Tax=Larinioides sclopetarius TaxID=280406 RepID=A0AAV2ANJ7_9ARAC